MKNSATSRRLRSVTWLLLGLASACGAASTPDNGSKTSWFQCEVVEDCEGEQSCVEGVCRAVTASPEPDADAGASSEGEMPGTESNLETATSTNEADECLTPGTQTSTAALQTTLARLPGSVGQMPVIDEQGSYWLDSTGALYGLAKDSLEPAQVLRPAPTDPGGQQFGLFASDTMFYWTQANVVARPEGSAPGAAAAPARIWELSRAGGEARVLHEEPEGLALLQVQGDRLLFEEYIDSKVLALDIESGEVTELGLAGKDYLTLVGDAAYWLADARADVTAVHSLFKSQLDGSDEELVTEVEGVDYRVWGERVISFDADGALVAYDSNAGCSQALEIGDRGTISSHWLDGDVLYFLALAWGESNGELLPPPAPLQVGRWDLSSGGVEFYAIPEGYDLRFNPLIVGQTPDVLQIAADSLLLLDKEPANVPGEGQGVCPFTVNELLHLADDVSLLDCGGFNVAESDKVAAAYPCLLSADETQGTQLLVNDCTDCLMNNIFVNTAAGAKYRVFLESDHYGDEWRTVRVESCADFDLVDNAVQCLEPVALYACTDER